MKLKSLIAISIVSLSVFTSCDDKYSQSKISPTASSSPTTDKKDAVVDPKASVSPSATPDPTKPVSTTPTDCNAATTKVIDIDTLKKGDEVTPEVFASVGLEKPAKGTKFTYSFSSVVELANSPIAGFTIPPVTGDVTTELLDISCDQVTVKVSSNIAGAAYSDTKTLSKNDLAKQQSSLADSNAKGQVQAGKYTFDSKESVTVTAGTYEAYKLNFVATDDKVKTIAWFAKKVGMVKLESTVTTASASVSANAKVTMMLKEFKN